MDNPIQKWKRIERTFLIAGGCLSVVALGSSVWFWGLASAIPALLGILCLALGFKVTELLVGILTGVRKANATAIALLFLLKLTWWGLLFWGAKQAPPEWQKPFALGLGTFLVSLLVAGITHFGMPKVSKANDPGSP